MALRVLARHKLYAALNVLGLGTGLAAAILILLFVRHELSYDAFFANADRLYQIDTEVHDLGQAPRRIAKTGRALGPAFAQGHAQVEAVTRITGERVAVRQGDRLFQEIIGVADPNFLEMFQRAMLAGDARTALADPASVVLTRDSAHRYFGDRPAVGQILVVNSHDLTVSAVVADLPENTHFGPYAMMVPTHSVILSQPEPDGDWFELDWRTYIRLAPGVPAAGVARDLAEWYRRTAPDAQTPQGPLRLADLYAPQLRALRAIHTDPIEDDAKPGTDADTLSLLSLVAVLILAVAVINFTNMATARASLHARKVGVRKTVGASRRRLMTQFMTEALLLTLMGMVPAIALVEMSLPVYSSLVGVSLVLDYRDPALASLLVGIGLVTGAASGAYPAFVLSGVAPATALKGASGATGAGRLRALLVVFQFAVSIGLLVTAAVVHSQYLYAQHKALGFQRDDMVMVSLGQTLGAPGKWPAFMDMLRREPAIADVAASTIALGDPDEGEDELVRRPGDAAPVTMRGEGVSFGYIQTMGLRLIAGRAFDPGRPSDKVHRPAWMLAGEPPPPGVTDVELPAAVVLNRSGVRRLGFTSPEAAIGQVVLKTVGSVGSRLTIRGTVIGVVEDFHFRSIHRPVSPAIFHVGDGFSVMMVRLRAGETAQGLTALDRDWAALVPDAPIRRWFVSDRYRHLYDQERRMGEIFALFSGLAIFISCLGLYGLAAFTAERRTKEIGIRKIMGATLPQILRLLLWQFFKPVGLACLIAWPVSWWALRRWLQGYAYRVDIDPLWFLAASALALALAWATVAGHLAHIARERPVRALRYE
ncbi:putative ABC transport system permease protein [Nitrospirillum amazonense]|uniref:Putative ABC transport system permease protein n=1 Tax=Nitrospirillum amazonense TaxID=28077 RepID=A0A560FGM4_9PROT|nr:ABC transporter permease [Nitrospirillum amazonense]TWB20763.1 putative ABC transport system permease protein [Nitrospirillum amazonense]